jgi:MYXO-CTERM domain-containing protein
VTRLTSISILATALGAATLGAPARAAADSLPEKIKEIHGHVENLKDAYSNYQQCLARGADPELCEALAIYCAIPGSGLIDSRAGLFSKLDLFQVFKLDCGDGECYQCCFTGDGCHTSFVGFPVINCNLNYGPQTRAAGITLITDPDAGPGSPCLTTPQTCDHLAICLGDPNTLGGLRDDLDNGLAHPLNMEGAAEQRLRYFGREFFDAWVAYLNGFHTGIAADRAEGSAGPRSLAALDHFVHGRGCVGWREHVGAVQPYDWSAEPFAITDAEGVVSAPASRLNGVRMIGLMRLLDALPNVAARHAAVESTVWPDAERDAYLGQLGGDADAAILEVASPLFLELLKGNAKVSDYRLLAVPLAGEGDEAARFNGCLLGQSPRVEAEADAEGEGGAASLRLTIDDPEGEGASLDRLAVVFWGDGTASREAIAPGVDALTLTHTYAEAGRYAAHAVVENTSGLRGFASAIVEASAAGEPSAPHVFSEVRFVDAVAHVQVTSGNERKLYFEITGRDADTDEELLLGVGQERSVAFNVDVPLGTLVGHNPDVRRIDRLTLWPAWRDGFYGIGWGGHWMALDHVELRAPATATDDAVTVTLPLGVDNVRVYPIGGDEPVAADFLDTTEDGRPRIWLHTDYQASRIEIDVPAELLASAAPGPLGAGDGVDFGSYVELRPGVFVPTASLPEPGEGEGETTGGGSSTGDADSGDSATSAAGESGGGGDGDGRGCGCTSTPRDSGPAALLLLLGLLRRRRGSA